MAVHQPFSITLIAAAFSSAQHVHQGVLDLSQQAATRLFKYLTDLSSPPCIGVHLPASPVPHRRATTYNHNSISFQSRVTWKNAHPGSFLRQAPAGFSVAVAEEMQQGGE